MRLADLLVPYKSQLSKVLELDALGLNLSRYAGDLQRESWPTEDLSVSRETVVLATVRTSPQFHDDLLTLEKRLAGADQGVVTVLCLEDSFDAVPVPMLAEACVRNGWRIVRVTDLAATRVRTGVLLEVRTDSGTAHDPSPVGLHNAFVLSDHERRKLAERLEEERRSGPRAVTVVREPADGKLQSLEREVDELRQLVDKLEKESNSRDQERRAAIDQLRRLEGSGTVLVGRAFVQVPRRPKYLLRLPWDLLTFIRKRRVAQALRLGSPPAVVASGPAARSSPPVTHAPASSSGGTQPALFPTIDPVRLRIATVARPPLVDRLRAGAEVESIAAGGWRGDLRRRLDRVDLFLVDAMAGFSSGSWRGLGNPGDVERTSELIRLLESASVNGIPSVLLVRNGRVPAGLRALEDRFTAVLPWELGPSGWDPGVPLNRLPWPSDRERADQPLHVMETDSGMLSAEKAWLAALKTARLQRWVVGADAVFDRDPGDVKAVRFPTMPFAALSERAVVAVPSEGDILVATAALAAGCRVVARVPVGDLTGSPGVTIVERPQRVRDLLERQSDVAPPDQLTMRRRLLDLGSTEERLVALAALLDLPIAGSLRRQRGLSVLASVSNRHSGEALARAVLGQTRRPCDVVVVTDQPLDVAWIQELRATGLNVTSHPRSAYWWQVAASARRSLIAMWQEGSEPAVTELADVELLQAAPDRLAVQHVGGFRVHSRATLATCSPKVQEGMPTMIGDAG